MAHFEDVSLGAARIRKLELGQAGSEAPVMSYATFSAAAETVGNMIAVTVRLVDADGKRLSGAVVLDCWLSDASAGTGVSTTAPNGGVAMGATGTIVKAFAADKDWKVSFGTDGSAVFNITDSGTPTFYLVIQNPATGKITVSSAITFA